MLTARINFDRANDHGVLRHRADDPHATLEAFRAVTDRTDTPPGPLATRLVACSRPSASPVDGGRSIGEGPEVRGTAIALLLAASGRPFDPDALTGAGTQVLAERA